MRTLVVYLKSTRLTLGANSEGKQKQLWIVYRKPCYLYLHHRYKWDFTRPWHLGTSLLTQGRKLRAFPILLAFQMKVRLSHFPLSMKNALRIEWILHHSRHSQGKKPLHLLAMVMLSQWNTLITCEGTNVCLCHFDFPWRPSCLSIYLQEEKLTVSSQVLLLRIWKEINSPVMQVSVLICSCKIHPLSLDQFRNTKGFQVASQDPVLKSISLKKWKNSI